MQALREHAIAITGASLDVGGRRALLARVGEAPAVPTNVDDAAHAVATTARWANLRHRS